MSNLTKQIDSLLELDAKGALSPHGIGGLARELLEKCKAELNTRAVPDVPELVRHTVTCQYHEDDGYPYADTFKHANGEYVLYSQAAEIIAARDAKIERLNEQNDKFKWQVRDTCTRAEAAEAKLAQYEAQEPVGFTEALEIIKSAFDAWSSKPHNQKWFKRIDGTPITNDLTVTIAEQVRRLYDSPVSDSMKAECDRYKEALGLCQRTLAMIIDPKSIVSTTPIIAFASATEAEAKARAALKGDSNDKG